MTRLCPCDQNSFALFRLSSSTTGILTPSQLFRNREHYLFHRAMSCHKPFESHQTGYCSLILYHIQIHRSCDTTRYENNPDFTLVFLLIPDCEGTGVINSDVSEYLKHFDALCRQGAFWASFLPNRSSSLAAIALVDYLSNQLPSANYPITTTQPLENQVRFQMKRTSTFVAVSLVKGSSLKSKGCSVSSRPLIGNVGRFQRNFEFIQYRLPHEQCTAPSVVRELSLSNRSSEFCTGKTAAMTSSSEENLLPAKCFFRSPNRK